MFEVEHIASDIRVASVHLLSVSGRLAGDSLAGILDDEIAAGERPGRHDTATLAVNWNNLQ
jgi:hypothetical protein